ncbi:MAG: pilus (MSHA type) biogenesis protein MshL [Epsilonproteobacteria bacterium]|nr:pilus (MSHA type) biogenesis protein MshL [Campylobacterota bacterium]
MRRVAKLLLVTWAVLVFGTILEAKSCKNELFSVTIRDELTIKEAIENIADTCGLSIVIKDAGAKEKLKNKLYFVKLKNATFGTLLDTILKDNNLNYKLEGNKLIISYLITKTFKVHYIAGSRSGKSHANVTVANPTTGSGGDNNPSKTGISISSDDNFNFWKGLKEEIHKILMTASDGDLHFKKTKDGWVGPGGEKWDYNPMEPIINPEAGMVTVTGTARQIERIQKYLSSLSKQVKTQVLIDVKILSVTLNRAHTTGIDWSQLYGLENFSVSILGMRQKNIQKYTIDGGKVSNADFAPDTEPTSASLVDMRGGGTIDDVIKFLRTQGVVKSISNPKVMTLNNQPALISVGRELFYKLRSESKNNDNGETTTNEKIDSVFAGILLDITPEIDERGMITLKVNPSITEANEPLTGATKRDMPPDLVRRQISSVIKVKNGHHAILGGLITSKSSNKVHKVPLLGDIPLVGNVFKRTEKIKQVEELVVIITPYIVNGNGNLSLRKLGYSFGERGK